MHDRPVLILYIVPNAGHSDSPLRGLQSVAHHAKVLAYVLKDLHTVALLYSEAQSCVINNGQVLNLYACSPMQVILEHRRDTIARISQHRSLCHTACILSAHSVCLLPNTGHSDSPSGGLQSVARHARARAYALKDPRTVALQLQLHSKVNPAPCMMDKCSFFTLFSDAGHTDSPSQVFQSIAHHAKMLAYTGQRSAQCRAALPQGA